MTDFDNSQKQETPPHFIVIVPGYMGSRLRDKKNGDIVWLDIPALLKNPLEMGISIDNMLDRMAYPNDDLEPVGIMNEVLFVPPWAKQEHYGRLIEKLKSWDYQIDPADATPDSKAVYTFAYDWRQDNRISSRQLGQAIQRWAARHNGAKAWIIAHSNGGIVSRWYIEKEGGKDHVERLFLMASPWDGAPKAMRVMWDGLSVLGLRRFNLFHLGERMKDLIRSFPSFYQLIPYINPFLRDPHNQNIDLFKDPSWLSSSRDQAFLADALKFNQDLGISPSVETLCFFGRSKPTTTSGVVHLTPSGTWGDIEWVETEAGDGTVPERSAVHPNANAKLPFAATHGDIYVVEPVLEFLNWELVGKYVGAVRAALATERYYIVFEPDQDMYSPGEQIHAWARVSEPDGKTPISDAGVKAHLSFHAALPGAKLASIPPDTTQVRLEESDTEPGYYTANLQAPSQEGYYKLVCKVKLVGERLVTLEEMILVEASPT